ncbi:MAG TPA: CpsD/CapB family tyrosine-protein kinase [Terriglobales bacterium]|jgi:capsular exopolysaccharide synthesis family protein|nr:CpsD/CapB family tyrosine-protein kinase [Terriglobales bacterium]
MSRIFDALKRSETERWGNDLLTPPESVTELLEAAEGRRMRSSESLASSLLATAELPAAFSLDSLPVMRPAPLPDARLVCLSDPGSLGAEKFRVLGLRLRNLRDQRKLRRIVVTGTAPEEGKSLVSANLALNQARSKVLKTLLIDGDFRRPMVAKRFGVGTLLPGLSECLRGEKQLSEVVYKLDGAGLYILPAGMAPENPLELMQSGRLPEYLDRLGTVFDWIIIDSPPLLPLADTTFWMKMSDGVLFVVREGVTERKTLQRAVELLDPAAILGVVVNSCNSGRDQKYYYSRYGQDTVKSV